MKMNWGMAGAAVMAICFLTACDSTEKDETYMQKCEQQLEDINSHLAALERQKKKGFSCENAAVLKALKQLIDKNADANYIVDRSNIVIWDYNPVGRYDCRAKVKKVGNRNPLGKKINPFISNTRYGLKDGGWVYYHTYITTKDNDKFYVGIKDRKKGE